MLVDFQKVADSVPHNLITGEWALPKKAMAGASTGIKKYSMPKGNVLTIGSGMSSSNTLLIKNVQSKFVGHNASFNDKTKKQLSFEDMAQMKQDISFGEFKKVAQATLSFDIVGENKNIQEE